MVVPAIPPEIVRRIVDEIPQEGIRPTLYAAALASRTFRAEAQRALFSDPGLLYIGHPDQRHNRFIDAILSSPNRLALLVWRYNQYTVWEAPSVNVWAYDSPAPDDMTPVEERRVVVARVARAFRLMTNLKHLTLTDMLVAYGGSRYSVADQLLQECTFKLESFSWKCRDDLFILVMKFLITQDRLKYLHLHYAYHDDVLTGGQFQDVVKTALPMLDSLSAPFPVSQLLIPEKRVKFLRWTGTRRVQVNDILHLSELGSVELLDLDLDTAPLLPSVLRYLTNVKLLKLGLVGPRAEVVQLAELHQLKSLRILVLCPSSSAYIAVVSGEDIKQVFAACNLLKYVDVQQNHDSDWILRRSISEDRTAMDTAEVPLTDMYSWEGRSEFI